MICFAILAHKDEPALLDQIRNIRKYAGRNARIVLYNGGTDANFGKELCNRENVMYCPYSRPLQWGKTGRFFYDVMRWLEEINAPYEYLVYTEYDVLFVNHGFPALLQRMMRGFDAMVQRVQFERIPHKTWWRPAQSMWREWGQWQPFFNANYFCGTFNPMQVYRHQIVRRMLARIDHQKLEELFATTNVFALGEMLYLTLAVHAGGRCRAYPRKHKRYLRFRPPISMREIKKVKANRNIFFIHPVKDEAVRRWICKLKTPLTKRRVVRKSFVTWKETPVRFKRRIRKKSS
ncbi:hypothetical protein [Brevibacillus sp. SYSU BS000544]|uniref:hypothetical protein n=1 Tax=Brevibacillus sp. SYSU BS000544 TaxID=3416443 RepID=UPI003CE57AE5